jgi:hypothetical protein
MTNKYIIIQSDHKNELEDSFKSHIVEADNDQELFQTLQEQSNIELSYDVPIDVYKANHIGRYKFVPTTTFELKRTDSRTTESDTSLKDSIETVTQTVNESIDLSFIES